MTQFEVNLRELQVIAEKEFTMQNYLKNVKILEALEEQIKTDVMEAARLEKQLVEILQLPQMSVTGFIFYLSVLIGIYKKEEYIELLLEFILESEALTTSQMNFIMHNVRTFLFNYPDCEIPEVRKLYCKLGKKISGELERKVEISPRRCEERSKQNVVVLRDIFLATHHAPTHSTLERGYILEEEFGVKVYIVATKGAGVMGGQLPYYKGVVANCEMRYDEESQVSYKDRIFSFYQESKAVDTPEGLQELIDYIERINPKYIVYIGNYNPAADVLNKFCPVIAVATEFSGIPASNTAFKIVGRKLSDEEKKQQDCEVIEIPFTFELREKQRNYTRQELCLPENKFVMAVVGSRLDYDVSDEFLQNVVLKTKESCWLFIGPFETYIDKVKKYPWLKEHSVATGKVNDVLGILECADLYVNPKRRGGGFSVIEGFHAGIPAVTCRYGDVAAAAGDDFCVEDYSEMLTVIERYRLDKEFYQKMCTLAKERETKMTSGNAVFRKGIEQMLQSERFY